MIKNKKFYLFKALIVLFISLGCSRVYAASLSIIPSTSTVSVGNILILKVKVDTQGKYINNAEGVIEFPVDLLEIVSINKTPSIFSLWVEEPNFSNYTGKINFNGGLATPGYNGSDGLITSITFRSKKQGNASVLISGGAVRANDGLGTDVLSSKNSASIQIGTSEKVEISDTPTISSSAPNKPTIISDTHPDQNIWYRDSTASFRWKVSNGVSSLRTLFNKIPNSEPVILYDNSITGRTLNNISEGTSYFHLRFFNSYGGSQVAHYKINIDYTSPILSDVESKVENNRNFIKLNATDSVSGIAYYNIKIGDAQEIRVENDSLDNGWYMLPVLLGGSHELLITAFDKAGNRSELKTNITSPEITPPLLMIDSKEITNGDFININGKSDYIGEQVIVHVESGEKEIGVYSQEVSEDGTFSLVTDKIRNNGLITIWAKNVLSGGVESKSSEISYLKVNATKITKITLAVLYPLVMTALIVIVIFIIILFLYLGWHKYFGLKNKFEDKTKQTAKEVHRAMELLKDELNDQLKTLEKMRGDRDLNEKEELIFNEIKNDIDKIDEFVEKKLKKLL